MSSQTRWSRRNLLRGSLAVGGLALAPGVLSACSSTAGSTLDKIKNGDKIKIAYADEVPYAYTEKKKAVGAAVSVHTHLLKQLGAKEDQLEWTVTEFNNLIKNLGASHDMVVAGMFVTADRCKNALFANPDYVMPDALLTLKGNPKNLKDLNSFIDSDAVVGVMGGTSEQGYAKSLKIPDDRVNKQKNLDALIRELKAKRLDGIALTAINLELEADSDPDLETTEPFTPVIDGEEMIGAGAAVFQTKDADLRDAVNKELDKLLKDKDKWLSLVKDYHFTEDYFPPKDLTTKSICGDSYK